MHGSNTVLGSGATGAFNTDSTTFLNFNVAGGNRAVLVNEGRLNYNSAPESSAAKGISVKEPITGPAGAQVLSSVYGNLF